MSSLAKCKNGTHGNENHATYILVALTKQRTYQNDMKSTLVQNEKLSEIKPPLQRTGIQTWPYRNTFLLIMK